MADRCFAVYDILFKAEFLDGQFLALEDLIVRHAAAGANALFFLSSVLTDF